MALGIDIADRTIRVFAAPPESGKNRGESNRAEVHLEGSAAEPAALKTGLQKALSQLSVDEDEAAVAIPSEWCHYRTARFPFRSADRIDNTFRYALEDRLPQQIEAFSIVPLSGIREEGESGASLFTAACLQSRVRDVRTAMQDVGLAPVLIQPSCASVAWHVRQNAANDEQPDPAWFLRDTGDSYELSLIRGGELDACLTVPVNGTPGEERTGVEALDFALRSHALDKTGDAEYAPLIVADGNREPPEDIVQSLCTSVVKHNGAATMDRWSVAAAAAAQGEQRGQNAVNLMGGGETQQSLGGELDRKLAILLGLLAVLLLIINAYYGRQIMGTRRQLNELEAQQEQLLGEMAADVDSIYALEARVEQMKQKAEAARDSASVPCLRCWRDLMKLVPDDIDATFDRIDIDQKRVKIRVSAPQAEQAVTLRDRLTAASSFTVMSGSNIADRRDGGVKLEMELQYNE